MNFIDTCYEILLKNSKYHDIDKDLENYNEVVSYLRNFDSTDRKEIEEFIVEVRLHNPIVIQLDHLNRVLTNLQNARPLPNISLVELYEELKGEAVHIILKGAYDSIKLFNVLDEKKSIDLINRILNNDNNIFAEYKTSDGSDD